MDDRRDAAREAGAANATKEAGPGDEAIFRVARVGGGNRRRSTLAALAVTVSVGGLALAGVLEGGPATGARPEGEPGAVPTAAAMRDVPATRVVPAAGPTAAAPAGSVLILHTRAWGRYLFVNADVLTFDAAVVIISTFDSSDEVVDIRSIDMPNGSRAMRLGASDRFQLAFEVDGLAAAEIAYVQANAYDRIGRLFASERQNVIPPSDPGWWRSETGAPSGSPANAPIVANDPDSPVALTIRREPDSMLVHGDVHLSTVSWVFVSMVNSDGLVAASRSVGRSGPAAMQFDLELSVPDWSHGPLWVQATGYDDVGVAVAQEQLGVWPDGSPMVGGHERPGGGAPTLPGPELASFGAEPVTLAVPVSAATPVTGRSLPVRGSLRIKADSITIALVTSDGRVLARTSVDTANVDGGIRPLHQPSFDLLLGIPSPRPTGAEVWLVITAFDERGAAVGFLRRGVAIGELVQPGPW
jgi:hypothetical protein